MKSKEELLSIIKEFIVNEPSKQWRPGKDHVHYSGPYFDHTEIIRSISTLLDGWLVLGAEAYKAEKKLAKMFDKINDYIVENRPIISWFPSICRTSLKLRG
jgi:hypothetical protein